MARVFAASWVFAACVMLGFLANRISGQRRIGIIVGAIAIITPWLFEVSRLVMETYFYPMALVLFLLALFQRRKRRAGVGYGRVLAVTLALLTYTYTIGRLLGLLMARAGVLCHVARAAGECDQTWIVFGATLVPHDLQVEAPDGIDPKVISSFTSNLIQPLRLSCNLCTQTVADFVWSTRCSTATAIPGIIQGRWAA